VRPVLVVMGSRSRAGSAGPRGTTSLEMKPYPEILLYVTVQIQLVVFTLGGQCGIRYVRQRTAWRPLTGPAYCWRGTTMKTRILDTCAAWLWPPAGWRLLLAAPLRSGQVQPQPQVLVQEQERVALGIMSKSLRSQLYRAARDLGNVDADQGLQARRRPWCWRGNG